jgi:hypothetical protein
MTDVGGAGGKGFGTLIDFQVGLDTQTIQRVKDLVEVFNIPTGGGIMEQILKLNQIVLTSGLPMDRYRELIWELAKQFADVGIKATDAAAAMGIFDAAELKGTMTAGLKAKMGNLAMTQQLTAGGFQGRTLTAAFAQDMWGSMDKMTRAGLDKASKKDFGKGYQELDVYDASNLLANLESVSPALYSKAMEGTFKKLMEIEKDSGWGAAEQTAQAVGIPSWREFKKAWEAEEAAPITPEKMKELMMTPEEKQLAAAKIMELAAKSQLLAAETAKANAQLNQQWYSDLMATWKTILGAITEVQFPGGPINPALEVQQSEVDARAKAAFGEGNVPQVVTPSQWSDEAQTIGSYWKHALFDGGAQKKTGTLHGADNMQQTGQQESNYDIPVAEGKSINVKIQLVESPSRPRVGGTGLQP